MKKLILLLASSTLIIQSCAIFKGVEKDPMLGKYEITIFETPYGDIPLIMEVTKLDEKYSASLNGENELDGVFQVDSTIVSENKITIETEAGGMTLTMELKIEGNEISGSIMDLEVKGTRALE
jgi:hypothetical protein|tara:strand:- start:959 stop:1327 length:369 start_codon:yes stop_codon:yes gene_type:complete